MAPFLSIPRSVFMSDSPYMRRCSRLPRSFSLSQMSMVGFGAVISFGLVSGGIFPLSLAGSAAVPIYMAAIAVFLLLMNCMAELTMAGPVPRSFTEAIGRQLGRRAAGFVRAAYFLTVTAIVGTEVTFLSPALKPWLGWLPGWLIGLSGLLCLALVIACGAKAFARLEMLLSAIKIGAVVGVLGLGCLAIWRADGPAPMEAGWLRALLLAAPGALWPSFVLATLGFVGIESLSLAARETSAAPHVLRSRLMRVSAWLALMVWVIVVITGMLLYTGTVPIHLLPTQYLLGFLAQAWAYPLFSLLIAVTVLSVINSQLFGAVRVLHEAARAGELPACLGRLVAGNPPSGDGGRLFVRGGCARGGHIRAVEGIRDRHRHCDRWRALRLGRRVCGGLALCFERCRQAPEQALEGMAGILGIIDRRADCGFASLHGHICIGAGVGRGGVAGPRHRHGRVRPAQAQP